MSILIRARLLAQQCPRVVSALPCTLDVGCRIISRYVQTSVSENVAVPTVGTYSKQGLVSLLPAHAAGSDFLSLSSLTCTNFRYGYTSSSGRKATNDDRVVSEPINNSVHLFGIFGQNDFFFVRVCVCVSCSLFL
jgi:hypothetical protein